jgi:sec-independent protein translocase protein TatA
MFSGGPWEIIIIALVVLLLFGSRLPGAAKSLGQSFVAFKKGIKEGAEDDGDKLNNDQNKSDN